LNVKLFRIQFFFFKFSNFPNFTKKNLFKIIATKSRLATITVIHSMPSFVKSRIATKLEIQDYVRFFTKCTNKTCMTRYNKTLHVFDAMLRNLSSSIPRIFTTPTTSKTSITATTSNTSTISTIKTAQEIETNTYADVPVSAYNILRDQLHDTNVSLADCISYAQQHSALTVYSTTVHYIFLKLVRKHGNKNDAQQLAHILVTFKCDGNYDDEQQILAMDILERMFNNFILQNDTNTFWQKLQQLQKETGFDVNSYCGEFENCEATVCRKLEQNEQSFCMQHENDQHCSKQLENSVSQRFIDCSNLDVEIMQPIGRWDWMQEWKRQKLL